MSSDQSWMDSRIARNGHDVSEEFKMGVASFLEFAYSNPRNLDGEKIKCPCATCKLTKYMSADEVTVHLYKKGFLPNYKCWMAHGEHLNNLHSTRAVENDPIEITNQYMNLVMDAAGPDFDWDGEMCDEEEPSVDAAMFFDMLKDAEEPLWPGCKSQTKLSAVSQLLNCKVECNMTDYCFNRVLSIVKCMLPEGEKLPENYYRSKQVVKKLGLGYENIDACINDCMLYYKENKDKDMCSICGESRFKHLPEDGVRRKGIPQKVLRYFPITPRLQRLYTSKITAEHMTWHKENIGNPDVATHPRDSKAWEHFNQSYPSFANESRNVRLGLSTDGFTPFGQSASPHSCWHVIVTPYNFPPEMCMKQPYMFLSLLIPGPKSPGKDIDVYLRPLIDELKMLWDIGIETYDAFARKKFQMKAVVIWTISDFPALGRCLGGAHMAC